MQDDPVIGKVIGSYRILSLLGEGGMARVYRAEHSTIGKEAALKLLKPEYSSRAQSVARFFHEAQAVNRIRHENLVDIFDFGQTPDGEHFILMELLHGEALSEVLADKKPMPVERLIRICLQICSGLEAAHQKGIVHRDLKDANVFLTTRAGQQDFVKILDFGIAKLLEGTTPDAAKTKSGAMIGTPLYISPEQARGSNVTASTDIYALGCLMYCMATGEPPFFDDNAVAVALKHIDEAPVPPNEKNPSLPAGLNSLILKCLEKTPAGRYPSMQAVAGALSEILGAPAETARLPMRPRSASPARHALLVAVAAGLAALGIVGYQLSKSRATAHETVSAATLAAPLAEPPDPKPMSTAASAPASAPTVAQTPNEKTKAKQTPEKTAAKQDPPEQPPNEKPSEKTPPEKTKTTDPKKADDWVVKDVFNP